ncbi:MAG: two component transcriptional regulator, LuxR family [Verrucomicrobiales bacterium]|nr:two component transcriptional regulator, LuxR family [Verrucomicrobiales bacterium]
MFCLSILKSVLIVDDHGIIRDGLVRLLTSKFPNAVFGEAENAADALQRLDERAWQLVLLDVDMHGSNGLDLLGHLKSKLSASAKVIVLTANADVDTAARALTAGAHGFATKSGGFHDFTNGINQVLAGKRYLSPDISQDMVFALLQKSCGKQSQPLSDREFEVLKHIANGKSIKEIAGDLDLSVKTVSTYRMRMFAKLSFNTTADVVRYAIRKNLVSA